MDWTCLGDLLKSCSNVLKRAGAGLVDSGFAWGLEARDGLFALARPVGAMLVVFVAGGAEGEGFVSTTGVGVGGGGGGAGAATVLDLAGFFVCLPGGGTELEATAAMEADGFSDVELELELVAGRAAGWGFLLVESWLLVLETGVARFTDCCFATGLAGLAGAA